MSAKLLENRYRIRQELGQGGFGETFLAEDLHMPSNRLCVIKQLKPLTNDPAVYKIVKERFQREAVILERLGEGNPQIPSLYAYFTAGGRFYLVQEWIQGSTLTQLLERKGLWSGTEIAQLLVGLLPVLDFIHDQGIVHRDIKPDNIIIRSDDQMPVLIDFGAVRETMGTQINTAGQTTSSIVIGTPGFMPSEQAIGRPVFSSDLYSLGMTAIYLLTGKMPQDFATDPATGKLLWRSSAAQIDEHIAAVINQAIQSHPRDRFNNAQAMLNALQASNPSVESTIFSIPLEETEVIPLSSHGSMAEETQAFKSEATEVVPISPNGNNIAATVAAQAASTVPTPKKSMADWQKAILTGGIVGAFLLGGILLSDVVRRGSFFGNDNNDGSTVVKNEELDPPPVDGSTEKKAETPTEPDPIDPPPVAPSPGPAATAIDELLAEEIVVDWLVCKQLLFDYPYDRSCGVDLLTGIAYNENIQRNDGQLSSVEWLEQNGYYYIFADQHIDSIEYFNADDRTATIEVVVTEERTLYDANDNIDFNASGYDQRLVYYDLEFIDGLWKIYDYGTIEVLWAE